MCIPVTPIACLHETVACKSVVMSHVYFTVRTIDHILFCGMIIFDKTAIQDKRPRWQVYKEAIGLSRVQKKNVFV